MSETKAFYSIISLLVIIVLTVIGALSIFNFMATIIQYDETQITELKNQLKESKQHADVKFAACVKQLGHRSEQ